MAATTPRLRSVAPVFWKFDAGGRDSVELEMMVQGLIPSGTSLFKSNAKSYDKQKQGLYNHEMED
jgi:hypothetical protein